MCLGHAIINTISGAHFITCVNFNYNKNNLDQYKDKKIIIYEGFDKLHEAGWRLPANTSAHPLEKDHVWICPECYKEWLEKKTSYGNLYLISDLHLGDPRLDLFSRDLYFNSVDEMNNTIINNINDIVSINDDLLIVGDVCYDRESVSLLDRINCKKRHLIIGNYDENKLDLLEDKFLTVRQYFSFEIEYKENDYFGIYVAHKPVDIIKAKNNPHIAEKLEFGICGHIHALWKVKKYPVPMVNVSADIWNFKPISFSRLMWQYNGIINYYDENVFFEDCKNLK